MTKNWKLPQLVGSGVPAGSAFEAQMPVNDGEPEVVGLVPGAGAVGAIALLLCSKPHAAVIVTRVASAASAPRPSTAVIVETLAIQTCHGTYDPVRPETVTALFIEWRTKWHQSSVPLSGHERVQHCNRYGRKSTVGGFPNTLSSRCAVGAASRSDHRVAPPACP